MVAKGSRGRPLSFGSCQAVQQLLQRLRLDGLDEVVGEARLRCAAAVLGLAPSPRYAAVPHEPTHGPIRKPSTACA